MSCLPVIPLGVNTELTIVIGYSMKYGLILVTIIPKAISGLQFTFGGSCFGDLLGMEKSFDFPAWRSAYFLHLHNTFFTFHMRPCVVKVFGCQWQRNLWSTVNTNCLPPLFRWTLLIWANSGSQPPFLFTIVRWVADARCRFILWSLLGSWTLTSVSHGVQKYPQMFSLLLGGESTTISRM